MSRFVFLASVAPVDFERGQIHAAIQRRSAQMEQYDVDFLAPVNLLPVCSPSLIEGWSEANRVEIFSRHMLLHSLARPNDWKLWLSSAGLTHIDPNRGMKFENSILAYEAALQGIGVVIGVRVLVEQYLRSGSLVAPFGPALALDDGYYLLIPRGKRRPPYTAAFPRLVARGGCEDGFLNSLVFETALSGIAPVAPGLRCFRTALPSGGPFEAKRPSRHPRAC